MPGGPTVNVWGYQASNVPATSTGGPTLTVTQGDDVTITLHNEVGETTGLLVQGQSMVPDLTGVADGGQTAYSITATRQAPSSTSRATSQRPAPDRDGPARRARGPADSRWPGLPRPATAYDEDEVLVLGEIDPALSNAANPAAFDMRKFAPRYFTIQRQAPTPTPRRSRLRRAAPSCCDT